MPFNTLGPVLLITKKPFPEKSPPPPQISRILDKNLMLEWLYNALYHKCYTSSNVHFCLAVQRTEECSQTTWCISLRVMWKLAVGLSANWQDVTKCWLFSSLKYALNIKTVNESKGTETRAQTVHSLCDVGFSQWWILLPKLFTYLHDYSLLDHTWRSQMFLCVHGIWLYKTLDACLHLYLTSIMRSTIS
jgi:hypothetical protein